MCAVNARPGAPFKFAAMRARGPRIAAHFALEFFSFDRGRWRTERGRCGKGDDEMRIRKISYLAVECLVRVARQEEAGPCTAETLAQWINRSSAYTEVILARLRAAGLVISVRGPGGGYRLARAAHKISVAEILMAVEEWPGMPVRSANDTSVEPQVAGKIDGSALLWRSLKNHVLRYLQQILLVDLATRDSDEWRDGHTAAADVPGLSGLAETVEP